MGKARFLHPLLVASVSSVVLSAEPAGAAPPGEWSVAIERLFGLSRATDDIETRGSITYTSISLFAKVAVVSALVDDRATWLAVIVALNAVVGLAYYVRVAAGLFAPAEPGPARGWPRPPVAIAVATAVITVIALVIGFAPQVVFDAAAVR